jgi:hypothetical protein
VQESGQSSGHAVCTVERPHDSASVRRAIEGQIMARPQVSYTEPPEEWMALLGWRVR